MRTHLKHAGVNSGNKRDGRSSKKGNCVKGRNLLQKGEEPSRQYWINWGDPMKLLVRKTPHHETG